MRVPQVWRFPDLGKRGTARPYPGLETRETWGTHLTLATRWISNQRKGNIVKRLRKPPHIGQKDWDDVDSPPLNEGDLARLKPLREILPDMAKDEAKPKPGRGGRRKAIRSLMHDPSQLC